MAAQKTIRKKEKKEVGQISTSSLPDIVFMILFFFMITVSMRDVTALVDINLPTATEIQKLENKSLVSYIYVGPPKERAKYGDAPRIQLNDSFSTVTQIGEFIAAERDKLVEMLRPEMTVSLRVNDDTRMGVVTDIKQALRRANALRISYAAVKPGSNN